MRAGRLVSIVLLLQSEGKLTSRQLAERLEVTERTIVRDMESLSAAGIPVYAERGQHGGWLLMEGYRTGLTGLHTEELVALVVSSQGEAVSGLLGQEQALEAALRKLFAAANEASRTSARAVRGKLHIDGAGWYSGSGAGERPPLLPVVQEAVWEERQLKIAYEREGATTERVIQPLGLVVKRALWYVVAIAEGGQLRTFRVSRLRGAEALEERFVPPPEFELASYWEQSLAEFKRMLPRYPAKLRIRPSVVSRLNAERYVAEVHVDAEAMSANNGWLDAEVVFETLQSACEIILSFGSAIEAVEPAELRVSVIDEIEAARMVYL